MGDDLDFYEQFLTGLTDEELEIFLSEVPDFMSEFPVDRDMMYLLKDKSFRVLLRKIKRCEGGKAG